MPNPEFEEIARQIKIALTKAGGESLVKAVYEKKVASGSDDSDPYPSSPDAIVPDAGRSRCRRDLAVGGEFQEIAGHPIGQVNIPEPHNTMAVYAGAEVKDAAHPEAAQAWLEFIRSPEALAIRAIRLQALPGPPRSRSLGVWGYSGRAAAEPNRSILTGFPHRALRSPAIHWVRIRD